MFRGHRPHRHSNARALCAASFVLMVLQTAFFSAQAAETGTPPAPVTSPATPPAASTPAQKLIEDGADEKAGSTTSSATRIELTAKPAAILHGTAKWDDGLVQIKAAFAKINTAMATAKLQAIDHPLTVFLETTDDGFTYDAIVPLQNAPSPAPLLSDDVKIGETPAGKAVRFSHQGAYQDIDDTYEALTAWLDEKGLEAQDRFMEEYLTDPKDEEDPSLKVDIYVFLK